MERLNPSKLQISINIVLDANPIVKVTMIFPLVHSVLVEGGLFISNPIFFVFGEKSVFDRARPFLATNNHVTSGKLGFRTSYLICQTVNAINYAYTWNFGIG